MKRTILCLLAGTLAAALALPARAIAVVDGPAPERAAKRPAAAAAPARQGHELVAAVIESVRLERNEIVVHGRAVALHPTQLRVFRAGQAVPASELSARQTIRFALEPDGAAAGRIVLVYIDR